LRITAGVADGIGVVEVVDVDVVEVDGDNVPTVVLTEVGEDRLLAELGAEITTGRICIPVGLQAAKTKTSEKKKIFFIILRPGLLSFSNAYSHIIPKKSPN
jgi:hypothetical protein